jgi:hypothetical protein
MLKRIFILVFILSAVGLLAMGPMSVSAASENTQKLQATEPPVVGITLDIEIGETPSPDSGGGLPLSTLIIFGLIAVLGVAVVIGGMALLSRRQ